MQNSTSNLAKLTTLTMAHKIDFLYNLPIEKVQNLIKGIATLSKGCLHPELFHPSFLKEIFDRVAQKLHRDYHNYKLAFAYDITFYDMQLATCSLNHM